jgi:hypothetical protein
MLVLLRCDVETIMKISNWKSGLFGKAATAAAAAASAGTDAGAPAQRAWRFSGSEVT